MFNLLKAIITFFGGFAILLAVAITAFLIIYIGYLVVIIVLIGIFIYAIKVGFDTMGNDS